MIDTLKIAQKVARRSVTAYLYPDEILSGLDSGVESRANSVRVDLVDEPDIDQWEWTATSGGGIYTVEIEADLGVLPMGTEEVPFYDLPIEVSCSCPFWQFQGPEYHGDAEGYLLGSPRGTATVPEIKDPSNVKRVCKHVSAVLDEMYDFVVTV